MTDQVPAAHTSISTTNASVTKDTPAPCAGSSRTVPYIADQLCHGFTPPGLIFQASRLNSAPGSVTYHGLQSPMTVSHLGNLRTYQRPNEAINATGLVQIGSSGIIGLSPSVAHQNSPVDCSVHPTGSPAVLGHVTDASVGTGAANQMIHVTGRLGGVVDHMIQDLSTTAYQHNVSSADMTLGKIGSDPNQHVNTVINYLDVQNVGISGENNVAKPGVSVITSSGFSNVLYPNLIVAENVTKGNAVTTSVNTNYTNLAYLGLTLASTTASTTPLTTTADMSGSQANDLSKSANKTSTNGKSESSVEMEKTTTSASVVAVSGSSPIQCVTLDTLASGTVIVSEDSPLIQGLTETRPAVSPDTLAGKIEMMAKLQLVPEGRSVVPVAPPVDCDGVASLVGVDDVCQGLASTIVYLEQHPNVAPGHTGMLRQILQKVIEADHNANVGKCTTIKLEAGVESSDVKVSVSGDSVTQWVMENPYRCKTCGKRFAQYSYLTEHMAVHSNGSPQCSACGEIFDDEDSLSVHRKLECRCYVRCDVCGREYNALQQPPPHLTLKPLTHNTCARCVAEINAVKRQLGSVHTGKKPYECATCSRRFAHLCNLQTHAKFHAKEKPFGCPICDKSFAHLSDVRRHCLRQHGCRDLGTVGVKEGVLGGAELSLFSQHKKPRPIGRYACTTCEKRFQRSKDLQRHNRIHTGERPYTCNTCGRKFSDPSAIRVHNLIHTGERPHKCSICGKGFRQSSTLHTHMRLHSGERPFLCSLCGKSFATPGYLTHHMRYHGEKTVRCSVCGQGFVTTVDLQRHSVVHTGEKPYKCTVCRKEFGWERNLKTHMKIHENIQQ